MEAKNFENAKEVFKVKIREALIFKLTWRIVSKITEPGYEG